MPIYEYHCPVCNHRFERLILRERVPEEIACPACGRMDLQVRVALISSKHRGGRNLEGAPDPGKDRQKG